MAAPKLVLASASPTRLRLLRDAGFSPDVVPSGVDESVPAGLDVAATVTLLAQRKAAAVASQLDDVLVLACDSLVELDGQPLGKPSTPDEAVSWWLAMSGSSVRVWTGHCAVRRHADRLATETTVADVHFSAVTETEIDRYVASGEPMGAAGAFRLGGRAAPFVDSVVGDAGTVHGLSLPAVRRLLAALGVEVHDLWV